MKKIIICEDSKLHRKKIKDFIKDIIAKNNYAYTLALVTGNPNEVINFSKENQNDKNIYFLDIDLKSEINGIKLAELVRINDLYSHIVFITNHIEMSFLSFKYKIQATDFISKDNFTSIKNNIYECLEYIHNTFISLEKNKTNQLIIKCNNRIINIEQENILFIESSTKNPHKLIIHEKNRQLEFSGSLKEIFIQLNNDFYRCHRAFIVNTKKIKEIDKKNRLIHLINGETCISSFRLIKGLLKELPYKKLN
ncbi:MAG: LytTR family DNA-binding domain-containing protein [Clostridiales bacterium]